MDHSSLGQGWPRPSSHDHSQQRHADHVAVDPSAPDSSPQAKRRRTPSATSSRCCRTCRLRKVKCTGNPGNGGPCTNCARLELTCPFAEVQGIEPGSDDKISRIRPSHSHTEAGTIRKRAQRACGQCHSQKTKCSGDLPKCKRCEAGGLKCEYTPAKRRFANVRFPPDGKKEEGQLISANTTPTPPGPTLVSTADRTTAESPGFSPGAGENSGKSNENFPLAVDIAILTAQELLTRKDLLLRHLDAYFENIYWLPCMGYFHPETSRRQVNEGTFDPPTAAALCALASFFVNPGRGAKEFSLKCIDEVEFFLFRNIHKFSEAVLLPYSLSLCFNFLNGSFAKVWQCVGIAIRLITGMQLNWDFAMRHRSFQEQERLRRVSWQLFVLDRLLAGGYEEYISCRSEIMKIRLPCREDAFWDNKPTVAERLHEKPPMCQGIGLHGLNVRLADLNHRIQSWTKCLSQRAPLEPSKVMEEINAFQNELTRFHASIPNEVRLSDQSITKFMSGSERVGFVYFHTHLSVGHIDLYRFALPGILDPSKNDILRRLPPDFVERSRKQAVAHALCTGRFCVAIQDEIEHLAKAGVKALAGDSTISHMSTQSLRVFLIAMQHKIYYNLTEDTTAPLWRFQEPDEDYIRSLITNGLFRVSEPWCDILLVGKQSHANNKAMFAEFEKTRKYGGIKGRGLFTSPPGRSNSGPRLPGPHFILENVNQEAAEEEQRTRASEAAAADRWFNEPKHATETASYTPPEINYDVENGPPGIPMLLAIARNPSDENTGGNMPLMYDPNREAISHMQDRAWLSGGIMAPDSGQMLCVATDAGVPLMQIGSTDPNMMFPPPQPPPPPPSVTGPHVGPPTTSAPFIHMQQPGMYMEGYANQFPDSSVGPVPYMQQANFN